MRVADSASGPAGHPVRFHDVTPSDRARLSGPGLRTFVRIADAWDLTEKQRIAALGEPGRSTYYQWVRKAQDRAPVTLPLDTLLRVSALLGVHKALAILFADPAQGLAWLRSPHASTVFRGAAPIAFILEGGQDGMMTVRRYLDAWRGGAAGQGGAGIDIEPVGEEDLVFA